MGGAASVRPKRASAANLAYDALKQHGEAMSYKDLIQVILKTNAFAAEDVGRLKAQIHTEINLDSRFDHQGGGLWALREWSYRGGKVITIQQERPAARTPSRTRQVLEDEFGGTKGKDADADNDDDELDDTASKDEEADIDEVDFDSEDAGDGDDAGEGESGEDWD